jgi:type I restriction-modification system DNA methylase subunit
MSRTAKKAIEQEAQPQLIFDPKRDVNPFWRSSLFSDVYLKNDVPREYKHLWENDEIGGFYNFYQGFIDLCVETEDEAFDKWREADTVKNWIVHVMDLLGWENNSERRQNSYMDNESFTIEENGRKQTYRPDLIYFDKPKHKSYTQKEKDIDKKLLEVRSQRTGAKIVVEAKYWDRLSSLSIQNKESKETDSASALGPELQTLKYMDIFNHDFGILTDGKTWRLFHKELSQGVDRRSFDFDLGNLRELALDIGSHQNEDKFKHFAKYFYYFFSKESLIHSADSKTVPFVHEVFSYSKKYAYSIEDDLKKRFMISMGNVCNSLKDSCEEQGESLDIELIRNVAESHLFNILFVKSCEVRRILPITSTQYLRSSLHEVVETLDAMSFDPDKDWDDYLRDFRFTFGKKFDWDGFEVFNRFINLYEIIHDGTAKSKDFGFEVEGFKESIFSKEEWRFAKKHKITNRSMVEILFNLNFIESSFKDRKFQQIPYSYFTPRQLGSIYESFLEFKLELAESDMVFTKNQWKKANLKSKQVKGLKLVDHFKVKEGDLFFSPDNKERKLTGAYYTPDYVVQEILSNTLGKSIKDLDSNEMLGLKICDPAMGSGHFLSGAIDYLVKAYREKRSDELLEDIEEPVVSTARTIVENCIYGVDINPRAVKLAKMSLWLVSAQKGQKLEELDDQLKCGDSLLDFKWKKEFPTIFKDGGFDVVVGNPPYVRQEYLKQHKENLKDNYDVFNSNNDLYAYFLELGVSIKKEFGYFGMIVTNKWMRAEYGENLRKYLVENGLFSITDFGDLDVFPGVAAYPVIVCCSGDKKHEEIFCSKIPSLEFANLSEEVKENGTFISSKDLDKDPWTDFHPKSRTILEKIWKHSKSLEDFVNNESYSGIKTGLTKVYVVDSKTRSELIEKSINSKNVLKPFAVGKDVKQYQQLSPKDYVLFMPKGWTNSQIDDGTDAEVWFGKNYPAIYSYMKNHEKDLKNVAIKGITGGSCEHVIIMMFLKVQKLVI